MKHEFVLKPLASALVGSITFIDAVDFALRVLAAVASLLVAYWAIRAYRASVKVDEEKFKQLRKNESE